MDCLGRLEHFLHEECRDVPPLIKAALVHVQFESIHPFLDGNGRLGRLLITFLLCTAGAVREPLLYLSLHLKQHRRHYYDLLTRVRTDGDWESWLEFFLEGVRDTAEQAVQSARRILTLLAADRKRIGGVGRSAPNVLRVHEYLQTSPILSIQRASDRLGLTFPTVSAAVDHLVKLGVLAEITQRRKGRLFAYDAYLGILSEGTEPLARV